MQVLYLFEILVVRPAHPINKRSMSVYYHPKPTHSTAPDLMLELNAKNPYHIVNLTKS